MGWYPWTVPALVTVMAGFCGCVARGARVQTPTGWRRIEELQVGEVVLSFDPLTGEAVAGAVTMTRSVHRETMRLAVGPAELRLTTDHPVYCPDGGVYANAGDWALGHRSRIWARDERGQGPRVVSSAVVDGELREVFDITVDTPLHNFLAEGVLVHNKSEAPFETSCQIDGVWYSENSACECPDETEGRVACPSGSSEGECRGCEIVDAGPDGSIDRTDAAADDAGGSD